MRRAVTTMNTRTPQAMSVSTQVAPLPMENAAPGLRMRLNVISDPNTATGSPGVRVCSAHHLASWSATSTAAAVAARRANRRARDAGVEVGWVVSSCAAISGAPASSCMACIGSHEERPEGEVCRWGCRTTRRFRSCRRRAVRWRGGSAASISRALLATEISCSRSNVFDPASAWSSPAPSPASRMSPTRSASATLISWRRWATSASISARTALSSWAVHGDSSSRTRRVCAGRGRLAPALRAAAFLAGALAVFTVVLAVVFVAVLAVDFAGAFAVLAAALMSAVVFFTVAFFAGLAVVCAVAFVAVLAAGIFAAAFLGAAVVLAAVAPSLPVSPSCLCRLLWRSRLLGGRRRLAAGAFGGRGLRSGLRGAFDVAFVRRRAFVAAFDGPWGAFFAGDAVTVLFEGDAARLAAFLAGVADLVLADALLRGGRAHRALLCGFRRPCSHLRPLG